MSELNNEINGEEETVINSSSSNGKLSKKSIITALFAALISAGCFIQIPLAGGIPIVIQDMLAMLSGLLLGPLLGGCSVAIFLILGAIGLPVFSGKAGIQVLYASPSSGFMWGYLISSVFAGLLLYFLLNTSKEHSSAKKWIVISVAAVLQTVLLFVCGFIGFKLVTGADINKTLAAVILPFIPGNSIKLVLMILLTGSLRKKIADYLA